MKTYKQFLEERMTEDDILDSMGKLDTALGDIDRNYNNANKVLKAIAVVRQEVKKLRKAPDRDTKQMAKEIDDVAFEMLTRMHHVTGTKKKLDDDEDYMSMADFLMELLGDMIDYLEDAVNSEIF